MAEGVVGPVYVAALLLTVSGLFKLRTPQPMAQALFTARLPHDNWLVRGAASAELVTSILVLVDGRLGAAAVAVLYFGFFAFIAWVLLMRIDLAFCGCLGSTQSPPTWAHAALNLVVSVFGVLGAWLGMPDVTAVVRQLGAMTPIFVIGVVFAGWLSYLIVTAAPRLFVPNQHLSISEEA